MTGASTTKLRCAAVCCAKSLEGVLKTKISATDKKTASDALKQIAPVCEKMGQAFFFSDKGEIFCAFPIFSKKSALFYEAGPLFGKFCSDMKEKNHIAADFADAQIEARCSCILLAAKSLSYEYFKTDYPDGLKNLENSILMSARLKNRDEFENETKNALSEIFSYCKKNLASLKSAALTFFVLIYKICLEDGVKPKQVFGKNFELFFELKDAKESGIVKKLANDAFERLKIAFFGKTSSKSAAICEAAKYIKEHCGEKLSLECVAHKVFLSPHYLSKAFFDEMGINFNAYLTKTRLERAKAMLKEDKYEISDIARAVGFKDISYFSKNFKKYTSMTPTEYKMKIRLMT